MRVLLFVMLFLCSSQLLAQPQVVICEKPNTVVQSKSTLVIYGSSSCPPCMRLVRDFEQDQNFANLIRQNYLVVWKDTKKLPLGGIMKGVREIPCYEVNGKIIGVGYESVDGKNKLINLLGLQHLVNTNTEVPDAPTPSPPQEQSPNGEVPLEFLRQLQELKQMHTEANLELRRLAAQSDSSSKTVDSVLDKVGNVEHIPGALEELTDKLAALQSDVPKLADKFSTVAPTIKTVVETAITSHGSVPAILTAVSAGSGVGLPVAGAILLGTVVSHWLANRAAKKKAVGGTGGTFGDVRPPGSGTGQPVSTVVVENPPPPQLTTHAHTYVPYETQLYREAVKFATEEFTRKYPGSVDTVKVIESLISQYLSSKGIGGTQKS